MIRYIWSGAIKADQTIQTRIEMSVIAALPTEVWHLVIFYVASKPRVLLALPMINRETYSLLKNSDKLWQTIFDKLAAAGPRKGLSASQTQRIAPDISLRVVDIPNSKTRNAEQIRRIVSLRFLPSCSLCGSQRGHRPYWQLGVRICTRCARQHFVSSKVLHQNLGLGSDDLFGLISRGAYTLPSALRSRRRIAEYSDHPLDLAGVPDAGGGFRHRGLSSAG